MERLVERVTKEIMKLLAQQKEKMKILFVETQDSPLQAKLSEEYAVERKAHLSDVSGYDYVVVPAKYFHELQNNAVVTETKTACTQITNKADGVLDLSDKKLIQERELMDVFKNNFTTVKLAPKAIITPLAADFIRMNKINVIR